MLPKLHRFDSAAELKKVFKSKKKVRSKHLLLFCLDTDTTESPSKFALGTAKKLRLRGVQRNRVRRQLYNCVYDIARIHPTILTGKHYFIVLLAIPEEKAYHVLASELTNLLV